MTTMIARRHHVSSCYISYFGSISFSFFPPFLRVIIWETCQFAGHVQVDDGSRLSILLFHMLGYDIQIIDFTTDFSSLWQGMCWLMVYLSASSIFQGKLLFDMLGTQFTCFTGTKVQILTGEAWVDYDIEIIVDDDREWLAGGGYWSNR